jgi:hypothetical protein
MIGTSCCEAINLNARLLRIRREPFRKHSVGYDSAVAQTICLLSEARVSRRT